MDEEPPGIVSEWYGVSVAPTLRTGSPVGANLESAGASFLSLLLVSGPRSGVSWGHGHSRGRVAGPCPAVDCWDWGDSHLPIIKPLSGATWLHHTQARAQRMQLWRRQENWKIGHGLRSGQPVMCVQGGLSSPVCHGNSQHQWGSNRAASIVLGA